MISGKIPCGNGYEATPIGRGGVAEKGKPI